MEHLAHHQINIQGTDDVPTKFGIEILNVRRLHKTIYEIHPAMEHLTSSTQRQSIEMEHLTQRQINIQGTDDVPTEFGIEILNVRRLH